MIPPLSMMLIKNKTTMIKCQWKRHRIKTIATYVYVAFANVTDVNADGRFQRSLTMSEMLNLILDDESGMPRDYNDRKL